MLDELKSKLKELAELRRDIQNSDEYIAERQAEYEATEAYKSYKKAHEARSELIRDEVALIIELKGVVSEHLRDFGIRAAPISIDFLDLSQYLA